MRARASSSPSLSHTLLATAFATVKFSSQATSSVITKCCRLLQTIDISLLFRTSFFLDPPVVGFDLLRILSLMLPLLLLKIMVESSLLEVLFGLPHLNFPLSSPGGICCLAKSNIGNASSRFCDIARFAAIACNIPRTSLCSESDDLPKETKQKNVYN